MDRNWLNERLLSEADRLANVQVVFEHKLIKCNVSKGTLTFLYQEKEANVKADVIIGADGVYSQVRTGLMRAVKMDFSQKYIDCVWCELEIPAADSPTEWDGYKIIPERLHIWPRGNFMLIALPNNDKSFTCTLFIPESINSRLKSPEDLIAFFQREFPDSIPLIGREKLIRDFFANPKSSLMSIKCSPYHYENKALILGDAAHNMVPFYGQGLNAGFEDLTLLFSLFPDSGPIDLGDIFKRYSEIRTPDAHSICDLALHNYHEMASRVISPAYKVRKTVEDVLYRYARWTGIVPLYTMVSFGGIRYSEVHKKWLRQGRILRFSAWISTLAIIALATYKARRRIYR